MALFKTKLLLPFCILICADASAQQQQSQGTWHPGEIVKGAAAMAEMAKEKAETQEQEKSRLQLLEENAERDRLDGKPGSLTYYVVRTPFEGLPPTDLKMIKEKFGAAAIPELVTLLKNEDYAKYRHNIITFMGVMEDKSAIEPLEDYLYHLKGNKGMAIYPVFYALARISRKSDEALDILEKWADTNNWELHEVDIYIGDNYKGEKMAQKAAEFAVSAIGFSGTSAALNFLDEMKDPKDEKYHKELQTDIEEAIKTNKKINEVGEEGLYNERAKTGIVY